MSVLPLQLTEVAFHAREQVLLRDVSLSFEHGGPTIVLGPNGAGKSLLLRLCHGLLQPTAGSIRWSETDGRLPWRQAMVFQRPVMLRRSVAANLEFVLKVRGLGAEQRRTRVAKALDQAGLTSMAGRPAPLLSGGEQQRLALARAQLLEPEILFMDEPTSSLDPAATRAVESMIGEIARAGTKIVMSTHDIGQAHRLAGDVIFLHGGRVTERTPAQKFFNRPDSEAAVAFLEGRIYV